VTSPNALSFDNLQSAVSVIGTSATTVAVIVGVLWAYFKFVRGRTYRPRRAVKLLAQWRPINGRPLLHARIMVTNIGASVVTLHQERGTGLRVSVLAADQPEPPTGVAWKVVRVFDILKEHEWIEAGETVSDDLLLDIDVLEPTVILLDARLSWSWSGRRKEIVVRAREIFPIESTLDGASTTASKPTTKEGVR
jgi:hypothetical protein